MIDKFLNDHPKINTVWQVALRVILGLAGIIVALTCLVIVVLILDKFKVFFFSAMFLIFLGFVAFMIGRKLMGENILS